MDSLPGRLSRLLVAYTIEFDNEVERRLPHRTSRGPAAGGDGPWLISQPFWVNFLRLVADGPRPAAELPAALINLAGLERWGHIAIGRGPERMVTLKPGGRRAARRIPGRKLRRPPRPPGRPSVASANGDERTDQ